MATQSIRIDKDILSRVKKQIGESKQPVSAFVNIILDNVLRQMEADELITGYSIKTDAVKKMGLIAKIEKKGKIKK